MGKPSVLKLPLGYNLCICDSMSGLLLTVGPSRGILRECETSNCKLRRESSFLSPFKLLSSLVCLISGVCTGGAALRGAGQHGVGAAAAGARQGG